MKKYIISLGLLMAISLNSCSDFVDGFEISPNSPTDSNPALLTTVTQVTTFSHFTGQFARMAAILTQQCDGVQAQYEDIANYAIFEGDNQNEWDSHYSTMLDAQILIDQAGEDNPYYRGVGSVIKAMTLGLTTDFWGDAPNSQALQGQQGESSYNPAFDSQQSIYDNIQTLLSNAITDFGKSADQNAIVPGTDDLIFGGDIAKWTAMAWVLKARYAIHLTKRDVNKSSADALTFVQNAYNAGMAGSDFDANALFTGAGNTLNQWYAFQQTRGDYIKMAEGFVEFLKQINDPRLSAYAAIDKNGGISGSPLGAPNTNASDVGDYFASPDSPAPLVTYVEAKFIEAEAAFRTQALERAANAHNDAIKAHILLVTGSDADPAYIAAQASETAQSITLEKIMTHKYVAMFTQFEVYNDWRRTGIPSLSPNPNGIVNGIPRRLPTPQNERLYNTSVQVVSDILKPVWWDE